MTDTRAPLRIDIVSDVVCPWCVIGYRQLEAAMARTGIAAELHWHPFELNPDMAEDGENLREHLAAKYGSTADESAKARRRLTELGAALGFTFNFTDDLKIRNTFRAHQLIRWASASGRGHDLKQALFEAFFTRGEDVNDPDVLAATASRVGLDPDEARAVLTDGRAAQAVREEEAFFTSRGVRGVPAMIFDGSHVLVGAQGVDTYATLLRDLTAPEEQA